MSRLFEEPERDRVLGEALRQIDAGAEPGDAEALRWRIVAATTKSPTRRPRNVRSPRGTISLRPAPGVAANLQRRRTPRRT